MLPLVSCSFSHAVKKKQGKVRIKVEKLFEIIHKIYVRLQSYENRDR